MGDICRLCCSIKFVNHYIFDESNSLYLKMSLYLPIKVLKNDRLPQKICDHCCAKINEFYNFYNKTIEVQQRLRVVYATVLPLDNSVELTAIKQNAGSPPLPISVFHDRSTQTDSTADETTEVKERGNSSSVKNEPLSTPPSPVKSEADFEDCSAPHNLFSDYSEDIPLIKLKKPRRGKSKVEIKNGDIKENKRGRKSKNKGKDENVSVGSELSDVMKEGEVVLGAVKAEVEDVLDGLQPVKEEPEASFCCICFVQCDTRQELLQHYRTHALDGRKRGEKPPAPPPLPEARPPRCPRCQNAVEAASWAAHWRRHWERDRRLRCRLCEKTFRDHHSALKHGLTHKAGEARGEGPPKRFVCDLCPEGFIYMRFLLAHRESAHPEAASRALALRCVVCARQFAHINSLRRHLHAHSGERNFLCSVCGKALSSREHLKFHLRIHSGYKPHACATCGKAFVKKCNLTLHERVHSGEKPHVCAHCGKAFSQRSTLVIHERYHSGARPYACPLCARGFVAKGLLSMHLKTSCQDAPP